MNPLRGLVALEQYVLARVGIGNRSGGRGYAQGVRTFSCPLCGEGKSRGWMNVARWTAGCWNAGCEAEPRLEGGALEWVRRHEGLRSRGETWGFLIREFPGVGDVLPEEVSERPVLTADAQDFCRFPRSTYALKDMDPAKGLVAREVGTFVKRQWGLTWETAAGWGLGACVEGDYSARVIIPVFLGGVPIAFQARTYRTDEPKYLTSRHGDADDPRAECGREAGALLFNLDGVSPGDEVLLVEGPGDTMAWHQAPSRDCPCVGLLGVAFTPDRLLLLQAKRPRRVIVGLDNQPDALRRAWHHMEDLRSWDIPAALGEWTGAKAAGDGARLVVRDPGTKLSDQLRLRLGRPR